MYQLTIPELLDTFAGAGELTWIGVRPARNKPMHELTSVQAIAGAGLDGDRYNSQNGKRQVTLIQWEHLSVISAMTGKTVTPAILRRNLAVKGLNLLALKNRRFQIGTTVLQFTGLCHPCSRMESLLGAGGYNAMRGHGGITARILQSGDISRGDAISVYAEEDLKNINY